MRAAKAGKLKDVGRHQKTLTESEAELAQVQRELAEVKVERNLLKKVRDVLREGVAVKYGVIERKRSIKYAGHTLSSRSAVYLNRAGNRGGRLV